VLARVVDTIVVEGRDHIQPYYFVPWSGLVLSYPSIALRAAIHGGS
jgi:hypothetical protein